MVVGTGVPGAELVDGFLGRSLTVGPVPQAFEVVRPADVGATFILSSVSQPSHLVLPDRLILDRPMPRGAAHFERRPATQLPDTSIARQTSTVFDSSGARPAPQSFRNLPEW